MGQTRAKAIFGRRKGLTVVDVVVLLVVLLVLGAIAVVFFLPPSGGRGPHLEMFNSTQLRGIHQGMFTYAQSNRVSGSDGFFPGLDENGDVAPPFAPGPDHEFGSGGREGTYPQHRFAVLLNGGFFAPEYLINPKEYKAGKATAEIGTEVTPANFSYALLRLDVAGRIGAWAETSNSIEAVMSDRMVGSLADPYSVWTGPGSGVWEGTVVMNDGSANYTTSPVVSNSRFGDGPLLSNDNLFIDETIPEGIQGHNALMVYATDSDYENQK